MADYIIQDTTLTAIADSIRAKTGTTDKIAPTDMPTAIEGIQGGGGGSADDRVKYVTFMNNGVELITYPVIVGDTCKDPYASNLIAVPTKDSDVGYDYTFNGWSLTDGGSANSNALKSVTEDRTVYAAYSSTARKYTITWLDEDGSTLKTEQVAYGTVPSYTPTKDGVVFGGWTPTPVAVTGDASYTVNWVTAIDGGTCGESVTWTLDADYVLTISGIGDMTNYGIGETAPWKKYNNQLTAVVIKDGVTSIGDKNISGSNIESVIIANSVTKIGENAVTGCKKLKSVVIPNSVTELSYKAFYNNVGLTSVVFPEGLITIGDMAFYYNITLQSVSIPASVKHIGKGAFGYCNALETVTFQHTSGWYTTNDETATSGTAIDVTVPSTNATNLMNNTSDYWKRT